MHPELFGSLTAYSIFLVLGILVGTAVSVSGARRAGLNARSYAWPIVAVTVAGLIGAKLYGLIESGGSIGPLSTEVLSQYRYPGGVIAVAAVLLVLGRWSRVPTAALADVIAPSCAFAMSVVRVGCLLAGCCSGKPSTLPWAIRFPAHSLVWGAQVHAGLLSADASESLPVHPLQLYFGLLSLSLGLFCLWFQRRKTYDGEVLLAYVTSYGIGQFLLEFLRFGPLPHVQYMALAVGLIGAAVLLAKSNRLVAARSVA